MDGAVEAVVLVLFFVATDALDTVELGRVRREREQFYTVAMRSERSLRDGIELVASRVLDDEEDLARGHRRTSSLRNARNVRALKTFANW